VHCLHRKAARSAFPTKAWSHLGLAVPIIVDVSCGDASTHEANPVNVGDHTSRHLHAFGDARFVLDVLYKTGTLFPMSLMAKCSLVATLIGTCIKSNGVNIMKQRAENNVTLVHRVIVFLASLLRCQVVTKFHCSFQLKPTRLGKGLTDVVVVCLAVRII